MEDDRYDGNPYGYNGNPELDEEYRTQQTVNEEFGRLNVFQRLGFMVAATFGVHDRNSGIGQRWEQHRSALNRAEASPNTPEWKADSDVAGTVSTFTEPTQAGDWYYDIPYQDRNPGSILDDL